MTSKAEYGNDLAYIHDVGFDFFAKGSAPGVLGLLRDGGIRDGHVVDFGCGGGIWARELVDAGYEVTGVDISAGMIAIARKRVPQAAFHVDSFLKFKLPPCDAVTALGEVFGYLHDRRNNLDALTRLFKRVYAALRPGGLLIFDVAEPGRHRGQHQRWFEGPDWACLVEYSEDTTRRRLTRHIVTYRQVGKLYRRGQETHHLQLYRASEIAARLRDVGFRVKTLRGYGDYRFPFKALVAVAARKA